MEFKEADRTTRNKIQVVTTLTLMARMGITSVLSAAGASGGALAGSVIPGVGNAVGSPGGNRNRGNRGVVPQQETPAPHAPAGAGRLRAGRERSVLLQE